MLRLEVRSVNTDSSEATPSPSPSDGSTPNALILFQSHLEVAPTGPATLFLGRMSWEPEADTEQYWHDGTFGMILESGDLTVRSPSGLDVPLIKGAAQILPANIAQSEVNVGPEVAQVLVFAFVSSDGDLLRPGTPDESGTPTP
jgi:hypothetical protein